MNIKTKRKRPGVYSKTKTSRSKPSSNYIKNTKDKEDER